MTKEIRWLISPDSLAFCDTFLTKVAFKVVCKGVWCLYNRQNSTWLLVDIGLLLSISHERVHWTRDISSWSLEEKLHWYNITHGVNSSLLIQSWQELFIRKKLSVIIFRYFMKLSRWERKIKIWENCNANGKMTKNKCVSYWTRDILSWSLEEKLHWYNITHGVNSILSIQFWQSVTYTSLRRKGISMIASVLH